MKRPSTFLRKKRAIEGKKVTPEIEMKTGATNFK